MGQDKKTHPALAFMRHEAKGFLASFQTDLEVHDVAALGGRPHDQAFGWILRKDATFIAFMAQTHRRPGFAEMVVGAFGADESRFYFWDGIRLTRLRCSSDLDRRIEETEKHLREGRIGGQLVERRGW